MTIRLSPRSYRRLLLLSLASFLLLNSCHTAKKAARTPEKETPPHTAEKALSPGFLLEKLKEKTIPYKTFTARAKLNITTPRESQRGIAAYIRMQKDSAIWVSVRPVLGIELIRVLITPDSVKMINFFQRTLTAAGADSLQQLLHIPYNFSSLQDMIMGNPVFLASPEDISESGDVITFSCPGNDLISSYQLTATDFLMQSNTLTVKQDSGPPRYSNQLFADYTEISGYAFSTKRVIEVRAPQASHAELQFSRVAIDEPVSFPFPEPDGFSVK